MRLADLNGQRVNVDVTGSGSAMTAEILLDAYGIKAKVEHEKQVTGVQEMRRGEIAGISSMSEAHRSHCSLMCPPTAGSIFFPSRSTATLAQTYLPGQFTHDMYPLLVPADAPGADHRRGRRRDVAVYGWAPRTTRYNNVARFVDTFFSKFDQFQQPPRHPKWRGALP